MQGSSSPCFPPPLALVHSNGAGRWEPETGLQKLWLGLKPLLKAGSDSRFSKHVRHFQECEEENILEEF